MSDLQKFHVSGRNPGLGAKIVGAILVVLAIAVLGAYTYKSGMLRTAQTQVGPNLDLPSPTIPRTAPAPATR